MAVNSTLDCLQWTIIDIQPKLIIPDLRAIRQAIESGFGFSILPDYLYTDWAK